MKAIHISTFSASHCYFADSWRCCLIARFFCASAICLATQQMTACHATDRPRSSESILLGKHGRPVLKIVFSRDGSRLASARIDDTVAIWDGKARTQLQILKHDRWVYSVGFS